jgi:hypothetical protein
MNSWLEQRLVEERYRDLSAISHRTRRPSVDAQHEVMADMSLPATAEAKPRLTAIQGDAHRPVGQVVGEWLIRAGVKLGGSGASMQAS